MHLLNNVAWSSQSVHVNCFAATDALWHHVLLHKQALLGLSPDQQHKTPDESIAVAAVNYLVTITQVSNTTRTHNSHSVRFVFPVLYRCASSSQNGLRIFIDFVIEFASVTAVWMINPYSHILRKTLYGSCCWNTDSALEAEGTGVC